MTISAAVDIVAEISDGLFETDAGVATAPTAPTVTSATSITTITLTIDGDASVTNYVVYKGTGDIGWQSGGSRSGDGDVTVTGLDYNIPYVFIVYSKTAGGYYSPPSIAIPITLSETGDTSTFEDTYVSEAANSIAVLGYEDITYLPRGGGSRAIKALVDYEGVDSLGGAPHGKSYTIEVSVVNSATVGISSSELDTGGDKVSLPKRIGEAAAERRITKIISQDNGILTLEVR